MYGVNDNIPALQYGTLLYTMYSTVSFLTYFQTVPALILSMHVLEQTSLRSAIHIQNEHNKHPTLETQ